MSYKKTLNDMASAPGIDPPQAQNIVVPNPHVADNNAREEGRQSATPKKQWVKPMVTDASLPSLDMVLIEARRLLGNYSDSATQWISPSDIHEAKRCIQWIDEWMLKR
jgi:hypothetical protein